ncbi:hypothetical protein GCM10011505_21610 [Tistrella bauzanensis]|uniref:Uncharacterized protein n=1 Tax=Tistrella bauzanensis TaxID=657419 RepID=A0ABQ1IG49_9PROT|nr:mitofilin family membrane protein [Tistrella bauzanensis]GGB39723.1 hypothetical protein GCM10011505_21610 [Tistrella bauzanensis]
MTDSRTPKPGKTGSDAAKTDAKDAEAAKAAAVTQGPIAGDLSPAADASASASSAPGTGADGGASSPATTSPATSRPTASVPPTGASRPDSATTDKATSDKTTTGKAPAGKTTTGKTTTGKTEADLSPPADTQPAAAQPAGRLVTPQPGGGPARHSGAGRAALGVSVLALMLVVIAGVMVTAAPERVRGLIDAAPAGVEPALGDRISALEQRLDQGPPDTAALEQRLGAVESGLQSLNGDRLAERVAALEDATARMEALTQTVQRLEAELSRTADTAARIGPVENRLATVEGATRNLSDRAALAESRLADTPTADAMRLTALALADAQLSDALDAGRAFEGPLGAIRALGRGNPAIIDAVDRLMPMAAAGVATRADLASRFKALVPDILQAAETRPAADDVVGGVLSELRGLVTVRRTGQQAASGSDAAAEADLTLAAMERRIAAGDLQGAIARSGDLPPAAQERARGWLDAARARVEAEAAAAALGDAVSESFEAGARETASMPAAPEAAPEEPAAEPASSEAAPPPASTPSSEPASGADTNSHGEAAQ